MPTRQVTLTLNQARKLRTLQRAAIAYAQARATLNRRAALGIASGREFDALCEAERDLLASARHCQDLRIMPARNVLPIASDTSCRHDANNDAGESGEGITT